MTPDAPPTAEPAGASAPESGPTEDGAPPPKPPEAAPADPSSSRGPASGNDTDAPAGVGVGAGTAAPGIAVAASMPTPAAAAARISDRLAKTAPAPGERWTAALFSFLKLVFVIVLLFTFLVGVQCLSSGIKLHGKGVMDDYLGEAMNPFLGLLVGVLATTLVQSSSVTTSLIVGMVGSGQLPVGSAIPMIMGANIGTTVTNTIASMAHAARATEFKRAFAAATCHDFFNFLSVLIFLPLELITRAVFGRGVFEWASSGAAQVLMDVSGAKYKSPFKQLLKDGVHFVGDGVDLIAPSATVMTDGVETVGPDPWWHATLLSLAGCAIILVSLVMIVKVMRSLVMSRIEGSVNRLLGQGGPVAILLGVILTIMVQSSSITTSILVPLAGAGIVTLAQVYPITLGANIGTTVTALLASMVVMADPNDPSSVNAAIAARQIAVVHLLFNLAGILVWYVPPPTRRVPLFLAERFSNVAARSRSLAVTYVFLVFFGFPALVFWITRQFSS